MDTTTLSSIMCCSDTALLIAQALEIHHMRMLGSASKLLHETTTSGVLKEHEQKMMVRNTQAELLPNGAHRLRSPLGMHTLDVAVSHTICLIFPDFRKEPYGPQVSGTFNPTLLMTLDSNPYIARIWADDQLIGTVPWPPMHDATTLRTANRLFHPESTILQNLLGGAWISTVNHGVAMNGPHRTCTIVHAIIDNTFVAAEGKRLHLRLICAPLPAAKTSKVDFAGDMPTAQTSRAEQLPSGAFCLRSLDGKHTLVATASPTAAMFFPDLIMQNPMLLLRLDGAPYVARVTPGNDEATGPAQWTRAQDFVRTGFADDLFRINSTILQELAGGAWISRVDHNVAWRGADHTFCTTVHLVLDKTCVVVNGGRYNLQLVCAPWPADA
jgi:hypothetical protein